MMKTLQSISVIILLVFFLTACSNGNEPVFTLTLPADTPPETVELLRRTMPNIEKHFPGLIKYYSEMDFLKVHPAFEVYLNSGEHPEMIFLEFKVREDANLPRKLRHCYGHHIFIYIGVDGKIIATNKRAAVSLLQDKPFEEVNEFLEIKL
ncbi:hypothetical protein GO013_16130 [Pseudodesulfovibrio sp. JC047]|uniref:hypothetical protein n=1 Tax=Pseudodesulfovibrio sp. JC047 TaxID=2683199 RepID=UPI0013D5BB6D|nr:hypothetical protein [Pseudodesulfovibrio sp. JC047]NDV20940.1 hypothetical protein [Pseudodesulfovibrio sp. JC047]